MCFFEGMWNVKPGDFTAARAARVMFGGILRSLASDDSDIEGAQLIFGELVTNSLRYSSGDVGIAMRHDRDSFVLDVRDRGGPFTIEGIEIAPAHAEGGRGLFIVRSLSHDVRKSRERNENLVSVWMRLRCRVHVG